MSQPILCIHSSSLFEKGKWQGLKTKNLNYYYQLLLKKSEFRVRSELENDPTYKQIIPQAILHYQNKYFLHRQIRANETRLNALCPLPLGGHVEEFDHNPKQDLLQTALEREVNEEAVIKAKIISKTFLGLVYIEDENMVNHMHVGIFYIFDLDPDFPTFPIFITSQPQKLVS